MTKYLVPGKDGYEFGTQVPIIERTFKGYEKALKKLKDDYEHIRKNHFPFYDGKPEIRRMEMSENIAGALYYAWYMIVPFEHITNHTESVKEKTAYLESGKEQK